MSKGGRPCMLDEVRAQAIVNAIAAGNCRNAAAQAANVGTRTLYDWIRRGRAGEEGFQQFWQRVKKAEADAELESVSIIRSAARDTWQAAAWWLERRYFARWGRKDNQQTKDATTVVDNLPNSKDELIAVVEKELKKMKGTK